MLTGSEPAMLSSRPCSSLRSNESDGILRLDLGGTCGSAPRFFVAGCFVFLKICFAIAIPFLRKVANMNGLIRYIARQDNPCNNLPRPRVRPLRNALLGTYSARIL
jgi:hypothetical protein